MLYDGLLPILFKMVAGVDHKAAIIIGRRWRMIAAGIFAWRVYEEQKIFAVVVWGVPEARDNVEALHVLVMPVLYWRFAAK